MPPDLQSLQRWFFDLATAPEPVAEAAPKRAPEALPLTSWITAGSDAAAAERLGRYAGMYFARLLDILADDFEAVHNTIGRERFTALARQYLSAHPSDNPSVRFIGRRFPEFVQTHPLLSEFPHLADLARLEWLRYEVFDREDQPPIGPEALQQIAPERWGGLTLEFISALRTARFAHPVTRYWKPLVSGGSAALEPGTTVHALVWRRGFEMWHREMDEAEARLLDKARAGESFGALCESLAESDEGIEQAAQQAAGLLARWVSEGLLVGVWVGE